MKYLYPAAIYCLLIITAGINSYGKLPDDLTGKVQASFPSEGAYKAKIKNKQVRLYWLRNKANMKLALTNFGARVVSLYVRDNKHELVDVALGFDSVTSYLEKDKMFFGAVVGRYANRIGQAKFSLDGKAYHLDKNNGANSLHGGDSGFYNQVWSAKRLSDRSITFSYYSKDGQGGFPGTLLVKVNYSLADDNSLKITYEAESNKNTVINLTNHTFFNLNGEGNPSITDHILAINAQKFTPIDSTLIPTGIIEKVDNTPFDFQTPKPIGRDIGADDEQIKISKGYDHNFVLNQSRDTGYAAMIYAPATGIIMKVYSSEPGLQFYSGNKLTGKDKKGKNQKTYGYRSGFCLETQHFPDSPNKSDFPSTFLGAGKKYKSTSLYKFDVR